METPAVDTPPLSPDVGSSFETYPSLLSLSQELELGINEEAQQETFHLDSELDGHEDGVYRPKEIREGKKPERVIVSLIFYSYVRCSH